jgi:aarF domain-containing kinase
VVATAVAFNDEAKYVVNAAQRSGRVVSTLFININEYFSHHTTRSKTKDRAN